jgi:hypothetical protein
MGFTNIEYAIGHFIEKITWGGDDSDYDPEKPEIEIKTIHSEFGGLKNDEVLASLEGLAKKGIVLSITDEFVVFDREKLEESF